jgi:hypothetical protein
MLKAALLLLATMTAFSQAGCSTSCGKHMDPLLWADGTVRESNGERIYETTPIDAPWLHFPSYRRFKLPHGFGTMNVGIETYLSLDVEQPVASSSSDAGTDDVSSTKFAATISAEVLTTIADPNTVIIENTTCENAYYVFARITDKSSGSADAEH